MKKIENIFKALMLLALCCTFQLSVTSCSDDDDADFDRDDLVGTWVADKYSDFADIFGVVIEINANSTWKSFDTMEEFPNGDYTWGTWSLSGSTLNVQPKGYGYNGQEITEDDDFITATFNIKEIDDDFIKGTFTVHADKDSYTGTMDLVRMGVN